MSKVQILKGYVSLLVLGPIIIVALLKLLKMPAEGAGALFILIGIGMVFPMIKWPQYKVTPLFWTIIAYVVVGSAMYSARLLHWGNSYETFSILRMPAMFFHRVTEALYILIFLLTLVELYKGRKRNITTFKRDGAPS